MRTLESLDGGAKIPALMALLCNEQRLSDKGNFSDFWYIAPSEEQASWSNSIADVPLPPQASLSVWERSRFRTILIKA